MMASLRANHFKRVLEMFFNELEYGQSDEDRMRARLISRMNIRRYLWPLDGNIMRGRTYNSRGKIPGKIRVLNV